MGISLGHIPRAALLRDWARPLTGHAHKQPSPLVPGGEPCAESGCDHRIQPPAENGCGRKTFATPTNGVDAFERTGAQPCAKALVPLGKGAWGSGHSGCPLLLFTGPAGSTAEAKLSPKNGVYFASRCGEAGGIGLGAAFNLASLCREIGPKFCFPGCWD